MNPLGLIINSQSRNRLGMYMEEILLIEGFQAYDVIDLADEQGKRFNWTDRPLYIISSTVSSELGLDELEAYVSSGGCIIASKPPKEWAALFGLKTERRANYIKTIDGYLFTNRLSPLTASIYPEYMQFIGEADLYLLHAAKALSYISAAPELPSMYPGIAVNAFGKGKTAIFTYDLASCIVRLHQGNPANSSLLANPDANRDGKFSADELFKGQLDYHLRLIPQADAHQDMLSSVINWMSTPNGIQPRFWHFPDAARAVSMITGDSDRMSVDDFETTLQAVTKHGAKYTCYIMDADQSSLPKERMGQLLEQGHHFGTHLFCGYQPSPEEMQTEIRRAVLSFEQAYGFKPTTHRGHCVIWVGWTEMAEALSEAGIRLDTNFYTGVGLNGGFVNGSALPVKFIDLQGNMIDLYEQSTSIMDDHFSPKLVLEVASYEKALRMTKQLVETCCRMHGVIMADFHPYCNAGKPGTDNSIRWIEAMLQFCNEAEIPNIGAEDWLQFNDGKRGLKIDKYEWHDKEQTLEFQIVATLQVKNASLLLPLQRYTLTAELDDKRKVDAKVVTLEEKSWNCITVEMDAGEILHVKLKF